MQLVGDGVGQLNESALGNKALLADGGAAQPTPSTEPVLSGARLTSHGVRHHLLRGQLLRLQVDEQRRHERHPLRHEPPVIVEPGGRASRSDSGQRRATAAAGTAASWHPRETAVWYYTVMTVFWIFAGPHLYGTLRETLLRGCSDN